MATIANRAQLLRVLKQQCAYDGPADVKSVEAFLKENEDFIKLEFEKGLDLGKVWAKTVHIGIAADAGEDVQIEDMNGEKQGDAEEEDEEEKPFGQSNARGSGARGKIPAKGAGRTGNVNATIHNGGIRKGSISLDEKVYSKRIKGGRAEFDTPEEAAGFGAWVRLASMDQKSYPRRKQDEEIIDHLNIEVKANISSQNSGGGALIPEMFEATLIDIRERYGGVTALAQNRNMVRDNETHPRRTGNLTVYTPGEGVAITESNPAFDNVTLNAKERATLTKVSNTLLADSAVSIADVISTNIAWSFEKDLEIAFVNGDGTSTFFGVTGLREKLKGLSGTIANIAGLFVGTAGGHTALTLKDFERAQALLPDLVSPSGEPVWLMHKRFYTGIAQALENAAGGVTRTELQGKPAQAMLGSPVVFSNAMPRATATNQVCALYGWFDLAAMVGRVNGSMEIATSVDRYFEENVWAIRGIHRAAVSVHDVGNASATESLREPGPVVGLITANS